MENESRINNVKLGELKICPVRTGRFYDGKIVVTCGKRVIDVRECITCTSHSNKNC